MRGVTEITPSFLYVSPFQPALPMRGVTVQLASAVAHGFISTRTPHAGSDGYQNASVQVRLISTRTPHAGSDQLDERDERKEAISTRTPHAGSDSWVRL